MDITDPLLYRAAWDKPTANENTNQFIMRLNVQMKQIHTTIRQHGLCYMIKFSDEDIRPMWEDQIDFKELYEKILSPIGVPLDCPLCQPYDYWDMQECHYTDRKYMTKIVYPRYPEGVIDRGGVWLKCPCTFKDIKLKKLKFHGIGDKKCEFQS